MKLNDRPIGVGYPVYIVAEMSANHHQDFNEAVKIIEEAKAAGADAIKIQTFTPDTMTINVQNEFFKVKDTIWDGKNLYDLYKEASTPWDWQPRLKEVANKIGLDFFSTPFDQSAVDFLEQMDVPAYKVASFELVDIPLLKRIAKTGKPVIISTGMASLDDIREAVKVFKASGRDQIALLKCTSAYPAPAEEMNLRTIPELSKIFDVPVGLSDHSFGNEASIVAVALGACVIEKHFTLSRDIEGPDSSFSIEPHELKALVTGIRHVEKLLGSVCFAATEQERSSLLFRRSLFAVKDIDINEKFTEKNIRSIRPGFGLHTRYFEKVIGRKAKTYIPKGSPLDWEMIS
ncbi:MAG: pseudaminic acid synthase [Desulfobacterales bacterium]|jgi:pseudaminic acid synthase